MKKAFALSLLLLSFLLIKAQENPRTTQYIFNSFLLNPAVAGIENYIDAKIGYRNQWSGIEGAPITQYVSVHSPIGDNYVRSSINSFSQDGYNPMSRSFVNTYTAAEPHHGVGFYAMSDKAGQIRNTTFSISYAYHLGLSNDVNLSVGLSGGISSMSTNIDGIIVDNNSDPLFRASHNNYLRPDLGAGIWLYGAQFFAGISGKRLIGKTTQIRNGEQIRTAYQQPAFYGTLGYKLFIDEEIAAIPSILVSYWNNAPVAIDANLKLAFRDKFWIGGGFRNNDSYSAMAGLNFGHLVNLSYSYDITTSALRNVSNGSHEIVIGLLLNNKYRVTCPSF
ncbi:MAG: type IX secretion system membrane protein PorP/SprF [Flavobacteriales bacterium]|nr:MAG: type IX secretion system membrane protein PorP/SprF [Flavobacteriales bacterium]